MPSFSSDAPLMRDYFIRRLLLVLPTLLGVTLLVFLLTRFGPGGPLETMLAQRAASGVESGRGAQGGALNAGQMEQLKAYYGYDKNPAEAYFLWLGKVVSGDLGLSTRSQRPVTERLAEALPVSIFYGGFSILLIYGVCIPLGVLKAIQHRTFIDGATSVAIFAGYAIPGYALASILIVFAAGQLGWFPVRGFVGTNFDELDLWGKVVNLLHHSVLPLTCYLVSSFAFLTLLMKNNLLDTMASDYMRTAVAKGLPYPLAVVRHALRNALIPIAVSLGQSLTAFVSGSFIIETVFNIQGMGLLGVEALIARDIPIVMGVLLLTSVMVMLGNILADFLVALTDPRVTFK